MHRIFHRATALTLALALSLNTAIAGRWFRSACEAEPACVPMAAPCSPCGSPCGETVVYGGGCEMSCETACGSVVHGGGCGESVSDCGGGCDGCSSDAVHYEPTPVHVDHGHHAHDARPADHHGAAMAPTPAPPMPTPVESAPPAPVEVMTQPEPPAPIEDAFVAEPAVDPEPAPFVDPVAEEPAAFNEPEDDLFAAEETDDFGAEPADENGLAADESFGTEEPMADPADAAPAEGNLFGDPAGEDLFGEEPAVEEPANVEPPMADEPMVEQTPADEADLFGGDAFGDEPTVEEQPADDGFGGGLFDEPAAPAAEPQDAGAEDDLFGGFGDEPMEEVAPLEDAAPMPEAVEEAPVEEAGDDFDDLFGGFGAVLREPGGYDSSEMRTWVDNSGRFSCVARLLGVEGGSVRLMKHGGSTATVSLARLSGRDLEFVNRQAMAQLESGVVQMARR